MTNAEFSMEEKCVNCRYYRTSSLKTLGGHCFGQKYFRIETLRECRLNPVATKVTEDYWCGQFVYGPHMY